MAGNVVVAAADSAVRGGLPERLRAETRQCHETVERVADIRRRVSSRADYADLLGRFAGLHTALESHLSAEPWTAQWEGIGVDIDAHRRASLLDADLDELGAPAIAAPGLPPFPSFGAALGCLYVLEGSAIGGRIVAGMVRTAIGEVPTAFLTGAGRDQLWPALRHALRRFDAMGGDNDAVVAGAVAAFGVFARQLGALALRGSATVADVEQGARFRRARPTEPALQR